MTRRMFTLKVLIVILALAALPALPALGFCKDEAATRPAPAADPRNGWDARWFTYERPAAVVVEEATPTPAQVDYRSRPPLLSPALKPPVAPMKPAAPTTVKGLRILHLRFRDVGGADVPVLLTLPKEGKGPFPVAIAVHGLRSHKAQMTAQVATALTREGFAVLALDLPMHGERPGDPHDLVNGKNLLAMYERCRQAVINIRQCIDLAEARPELNANDGVVLVGYSLGSLMNAVAGASDDRVKAMALMVGGTPEFHPAMVLVPQFAALQPQLAISHFAGRPLLMLNGRHDAIITADMADRLFSAAADPKEQRWYDSAHLLPEKAYEDAATWLKSVWDARPRRTAAAATTGDGQPR